MIGDADAPFSPQGHAALSLWLDPYDTSASSLDLVSGAVATWKDKSGNGRHFTEATNRPTWSASGLATGVPGITFDGTASKLVYSGAWMYAANGCTVLMMCVAPLMGLGKYVFSEGSTSSVTPVYAPFRSLAATATSAASQITNDAGTNLLASTPQGGTSFAATPTLLVTRDTGLNMSRRKNGAAGNNSDYTRSATTLNTTCIGARAKATPDNHAAITIGEIIVLSEFADLRVVQMFEAYMTRRAREAVTLGTGQPWSTPGDVP